MSEKAHEPEFGAPVTFLPVKVSEEQYQSLHHAYKSEPIERGNPT